ncbi:helix-turn-helix transcriptional regulator [Arthrobacter mangrovi]|uniref:LuxR family transcriptional regulator n=1 Tax=Arthrobacter mangrovi TaxID=2966350 RepID=A0ABQ5MZ67_9MICC|nr:LuxR C-terminal-related transcriptional regulator [Arthrobacter mangrovi]GLB69290.1 LuxR family transcriptional regulator [Arthrobacter mangrovi]
MVHRNHHSLFVGRQQELSILGELLQDVKLSRSRTAVITGRSGTGKSAVLDRFLAEHPELQVLRSGGLEWVRPEPRAGLGRIAAGADPARLVASLQAQGPVAVVLEDIQWVDAESVHELLQLAEDPSAGSLLLLLTLDSSAALDPATARHLSGHSISKLALEPLSPAEIRELHELLTGRTLAGPAAQQLRRHTGGKPGYVRELVPELPPAFASVGMNRLPAPSSTAAQVARQLEAASADARALIEATAIIGQSGDLFDIAAIAEVSRPLAVMDAGVATGLLRTEFTDSAHLLDFRLPLFRAAVYDTLSGERRAALHRRASRVLPDEALQLWHLARSAPDADDALADRLDEFAAGQAANGAWAAAADALLEASRLSTQARNRQGRLVRAVDALVGAGRLVKAIRLLPALESMPASAERDGVLGYLAACRGREAEARFHLDNAWRRRPSGDRATGARIAQRQVIHALARWQGADIVEWATRAVELAEPGSPTAIETKAIIGLGLAASGQPDAARRHYEAVLADAPPGAHSQRVLLGSGWTRLALDDPETARMQLEAAVPSEYRSGSLRISLWASAWLARTHFTLGDWDAALAVVGAASAQLERAQLDLLRPLIHWTGVQIHALRGNPAQAREHLLLGAALAENYESMVNPALLAHAQLLEAAADYQGVVRVLAPLAQTRSAQLAEPFFWIWQDTYANALVVLDRVDEASAFLAPYESLAAERRHRTSLSQLRSVRGRIHAAKGDLDAMRRSYQSGLGQLEGLSAPYYRARVQYSYGQSLRRAGKRRESAEQLAAARQAFVQLNAQVYVARCERELVASGVDVQRRDDPTGTSLTAQEEAVARLVARGKSNREAAQELIVSVKTVEYHLTRIYAKLQIRSRTELAARYRPEDQA